MENGNLSSCLLTFYLTVCTFLQSELKIFFIYNLNQQSEFTFYKLMFLLLQCLDGESSSGESPVPQIRSIGQFLLSRLFSSLNSSVTFEIWNVNWKPIGSRGSLVIKALDYETEGRGFETRWGEFLNLPNPYGRIRPWGLLSLYQKWVQETLKKNHVSGE
jgi:hypothetical protein